MRDLGAMLAVGAIAGTAIGVTTLLRAGDCLAAAIAAAALACLAPSRRGATALLLAAGVLAAAAHGAAARDQALYPPLLAWFDARTSPADRVGTGPAAVVGAGNVAGADRSAAFVVIEGVIAEDASPVDDGVRLVVDVTTVRDAAQSERRRAPGRVQLHVAGALGAGAVRAWTAGRRIRAPATLRPPQMLLNFGGPSPFWQRLRRPFVLSGSVKSAALVEVERGGWWAEASAGARWRARDAAARFIAPRDPEAAAVVTAILIGDRAGLDDEVVRRLQVAGTYHVIAISGGNVALLTGLCFLGFRLVLRSPRGVAGLTLLTTIAYAGIVGGDPSVMRAVTVAVLYLGIGLAGVVPSPLATLRTAACVLAVADPLVVADVGAWLSFGATLGILVFAAPMVRLAPWHAMPAWCRAVFTPPVVLCAATLAAELALVPIAAAVFGRVTMAGLILNLIAIPAMAVVEAAGLVTVIAGPLWPAAGALSGEAAWRAAHVLVASSALTDWWPWLWRRVPGVPAVLIVAYYAAVCWAWWSSPAGWHRRAALAAAAAALVVIVWAPAVERARPTEARLRISLIDVGQGDAILLQLPSGQSLLVDTGGSPGSFDIGARVVTPAAWSLGVRTLTWLALTHGDRDHVGGAFGVTEDLVPREIWEGVPVPRNVELSRLKRLAADRGIAWRTVQRGDRVEVGRLCIEAVHPPDPEWERQRVRNDDSLVLRILYGRVAVLLTGDAGAEFEARLPPGLADSPIRILKAGHHGSRSSTSDRLIAALRPQAALISVGRGNLFGHPAADVLARLVSAGAEIFRTDRDGAISLETDGVSVRILTALGRRWTISAIGPS